MTTIIPPREGDLRGSGIKLPASMWGELDEVAGLTGWSRNKVIEFLLRHALDSWDKNERSKFKTPESPMRRGTR